MKGNTTWLTPYCDAWRQRWGEESEPPIKELCQQMKIAEKRIGPQETAFRWRVFLAQTPNPNFARPARFVQGLGQWKARPLPL